MLSFVCLSVVWNVYAPYSAGWNFRKFFYAIWYLGHPLTFTENFTEIVPENPFSGKGLNAIGVAKCSDFWYYEGYIWQKVQDSSWAFDWYQNRRPWMTLNGKMGLILRYFTEFSSFRGALHKSGWQSHNYGQVRITMTHIV